MMTNERIIKLEIKRIELCDLLLACLAVDRTSDGTKWKALHDKLRAQLDAFDEKMRV